VRKIRLLAIVAAALASVAAAEPPRLSISFSQTAVTVSELPPGHDVLVFSIAREAGRYYATQVRRERVLSPVPGSQTTSWDIGKQIPLKSVWCAIDLQRGDFDIKSPSGFAFQRMIDGPAFPRDGTGALAALTHERADAFVLLVTPGRGVWLLRSGDGGAADDDSRAGKARVAFSKLSPILKNGPPAPKSLTPNDVVIVIDPVYLDVWSGRVGDEVQP